MAKIIALSQLRDAVREVAVNQIYKSLQHRDELYLAIIEALEELEDQLEEQLARETAEQEIQGAIQAASKVSKQGKLVLSELANAAKDMNIGAELRFPSIDWQNGTMTPFEAMKLHAALSPFASRDGAALTGKPAAFVRSVQDHAERMIEAQLGQKATDIWAAGRARYGQLMRVNDLLTDKASTLYRNGVPDLNELQKRFLDDFTGNPGLKEMMGNWYTDLKSVLARKGSILVQDVPGYKIGLGMRLYGRGVSEGVPGLRMPAKLAGTPGQLPVGAANPAAAFLGAGYLPTEFNPLSP